MEKVYFASCNVKAIDAEQSLPGKYLKLLDKFDFEKNFKGKTVAIKMHLGSHHVYTTIRPYFVRLLVDKIKAAGGKPFITDGTPAVWDTARRGYTEETLGAKIFPAAGATEKYFRTVKVKHPKLKELELCGNIVDADAMVVLTHFKAHGEAAFGGALKNLAMGCVTCRSRGALHRLVVDSFRWDKAKCSECGRCIENCRFHACRKTGSGDIDINVHHCVYCRHCEKICSEGAIKVSSDSWVKILEGLAIAAREVVKGFPQKHVLYLNLAMDITSLCDCWGFSSPVVIPDIGIFGSWGMLAADRASLDAVDPERFIPGSLIGSRPLAGGEGHLFERMWGIDPYRQIKIAEDAGIESSKYKLVQID